MVHLSRVIRHLVPCVVMLCTLLLDAVRFLWRCLRSPAALAAEHLFLRKQLALYQARHVKPRHATDAIRVALVWLSQWFDWPQALTVVHPETFSRWRRQGVGLCWHWQPKRGRPPIPVERPQLIRQMARAIAPGASGGSPTNCGSSWVCGSHHAPSGSVCPYVCTLVQANARRPSAGARSCTITRGTSSSVVWPPISPEVDRPWRHG
jgi:hypothetical protein